MSVYSYVLVLGICFSYLVYLTILVRQRRLDLLDFFFHSIISIVPPIFMLCYNPLANVFLSLGIRTPSFIFFGAFLVILFLYISRLMVVFHQVEKRQTRLIEELSLLNADLHKLKENIPS